SSCCSGVNNVNKTLRTFSALHTTLPGTGVNDPSIRSVGCAFAVTCKSDARFAITAANAAFNSGSGVVPFFNVTGAPTGIGAAGATGSDLAADGGATGDDATGAGADEGAGAEKEIGA